MKKIVGRSVLHFGAALAAMIFAVSPSHAEMEEVDDPLESVNRGIFWFNDQVDVYVLEPVARGYDWIMPDRAKKGVVSFFDNLKYPSYLVSDLVQGKFDQAGTHTGRFLLNSTIGVLGFYDVAEDFGLERHKEDFGIALAYHEVPAGPYLVLPFLGPSNLRDAVGLAVDSVLDPLAWLSVMDMDSSTRVAIQMTALGLRTVQTRAGLLQAVETAKESSVDYYLFVQGAYYQYRHGLLTDGKDEDDDFTPEPEADASAEPNLGHPTSPPVAESAEKQ